MGACEHKEFEAEVTVNRIEDTGQFAADVHIQCRECKKQFRFLGLPGGVSMSYPTISIDGTEARLPIAPGSLFDDIPGVSPIDVAWKHVNEMEKNMVVPKMPEGYYLMQESGFWYVLKDEGLFMKRLLDKDGNDMRFEPNTSSPARARAYAQKHKDAGLKASQAVPENEP